jgi:hypothetical protein
MISPSHRTGPNRDRTGFDHPGPQTLLERPAEETMIEFLRCLHQALKEEEYSLLYWEGSRSAAQFVALVTMM